MWKLWLALLSKYPRLKKAFWRFWYNAITSRYKGDDLLFMNYGYAYLPQEPGAPNLSPTDEEHRYQLQLYHVLASEGDLRGKDVLEVGSGRGGGADYLVRTFSPRSYTAVELSPEAVAYCQAKYARAGFSFKVGEAEQLPIDDESMDVVLNVESSHCYPSVSRFLAEVRRVLRRGGLFLFTDVRQIEALPMLEEALDSCGLETLKKRDIRKNVVAAMSALSELRRGQVARSVPRPLVRSFESFAGVEGGIIFETLKDGRRVYPLRVMRKP